jgi:hypothetical protein
MTDTVSPPSTVSPGMPEPVPLAPPPGPRVERIRFSGTAGEYFGIWIVNLFLTVITLGIYSAWAKVRKKRYFYGNTWLADGNFEYHGNPLAILKGRLLAFAAFIGYTLLTRRSPPPGRSSSCRSSRCSCPRPTRIISRSESATCGPRWSRPSSSCSCTRT